tara:strand:+ start:5110 stop:5448 length:339 start_codon:yes stop_codon:yes gene_type:complete
MLTMFMVTVFTVVLAVLVHPTLVLPTLMFPAFTLLLLSHVPIATPVLAADAGLRPELGPQCSQFGLEGLDAGLVGIVRGLLIRRGVDGDSQRERGQEDCAQDGVILHDDLRV